MHQPSQFMRAVLLNGIGGFDQLEYREDIAVPKPGTGDVLIRVGAAGINNTDVNTRIGWYSKAGLEAANADEGATAAGGPRADISGWTGAVSVFPRIQGADCCGTIVAVGSGVAPARMGERVLVEPVFHPVGLPFFGSAIYFGSECNGAFAEYTTVPAAHAYKVTSELSDAELATFPCSYSAAENMLTRAGLQAGETVLVTGASGGVGSAAVQLAKRRAATVFAVAASDKASMVGSLGADRVIARDAKLIAEVDPASIDVVVDVVGGREFGTLLDLLRRGGRYAVAGAIAGSMVELDLRTLYLKDLRLLGCTVLDASVFPNLVGYIERGEIRPTLAKAFPLSAIVRAQTEFLERRHPGKLVLIPSG